MPDTTVLVLGTCDTKLQELLFLKDQVQAHSPVRALLLDVGRDTVQHDQIDIPRTDLITGGPDDEDVSRLPRSEVIKFMAGCAGRTVRELYQKGEIHGIVSAGGSGGTSLAAEVMRNELPIGFPKMIISTVASGDTGPIVGETDITMVYSVVDVAGLNQLLRDILSNAGAAIAAMAQAFASRSSSSKGDAENSTSSREAAVDTPTPPRKRIGITMFGVTTPGVDAIRRHLASKYDNDNTTLEVYVFHATGHGGKAMERLVRDGALDAVLDLTTTEVCDLVTGGVMSAGPGRLDGAAAAAAAGMPGIPYVVSVGATDMANFGPRDTVPERYRHRRLYEHNANVTLMRTSAEECREVGRFIVEKVLLATKKGKGSAASPSPSPSPSSSSARPASSSPVPVQVWLPRGGVSMLSTPPDGPFADAEADEALFATIRDGLAGSGVEVVEDPRDINDEGFAGDIAEALARLMGL